MPLSRIESVANRWMMTAFLLMAVTFALPAPAGAMNTKKFMGRFDINLQAGTPDFSILKGLDMNLAYGYRVAPAYQDGLFLRIDQWTVNTPINIGDLLETFTEPVYFKVEPGADIIFIRQFAHQKDALLALPKFDPRKVPFDSQHALSMKLGEAVIVPMRLNLAGGVMFSDVGLPVSPFVDGHYFVSGLFQVEVLRLTGNQVRLRIVASRQAGHQVSAGLSSDLQFFKLAPLNALTNLMVGENLGAMTWASTRQNLFMADYIFDLSSSSARNVYDRLVTSKKVLHNVALADPFGKTDKARNLFIADLSEADALVRADKGQEHPRVQQVFKGRDIGTREGWDAQVGFRFAYFDRSHHYSYDNHMIFLDSDNKKTNYLMPTDERRSDTHLFWGWIDEVSTRNASVVAQADQNGTPNDLGSYVLTREVKDKDLRESESEDLLHEYRRLVPEEVRRKMGIERALDEKAYDDARVYFEVIVNFNEIVNRAVGLLTADQLHEAMSRYLADHAADLPSGQTGGTAKNQRTMTWAQSHSDEVDHLVDEMHAIFRRSSMTYRERIEHFMRLQADEIYRMVGTGFLTSLIPERDLADVIKVSVMISAQNLHRTINVEYGHSPAADAVHVSQYIQNLIAHGGFDVRLESFGQPNSKNGQVLSMREIGKKYAKTPVPTFEDTADN